MLFANLVLTSDLEITSLDVQYFGGYGTNVNIYSRDGSGEGFEGSLAGWTLCASFSSLSQGGLYDDNILLSGVNGSAGDTIAIMMQPDGACYFAQAAPVNTVMPYEVDNFDANLGVTGCTINLAQGPGVYQFVGGVNYTLSSYTYAWSTGQTTEDASGLGLGPISVTVTDCNECIASWSGFVLTNYVYGCIDALASNFDASANTSWDLDPTGEATACLFDGCTDPLATNYDANANNNVVTCLYDCIYYEYDDLLVVEFTADSWPTESSWNITDLDNNIILAGSGYTAINGVYLDSTCVLDGCYYLNVFDSEDDGGATVTVTDNSGNVTTISGGYGALGTSLFTVGAANCTVGCTEEFGADGVTPNTNYDVNAVIDDGSCIDYLDGCTDPSASNYNAFANVDDASCCYENSVSVTVGGGTWLNEISWTLRSSNGDSITSGGAPFDSTLCLADDCYTVDMFDSSNDGWDGGSTFDATAGGSLLVSEGLTSGAAGSFTFAVGTGDCAVFGCTDPNAINYDQDATDDDGSCCTGIDMVTVTIDPQDTYAGENNWVLWSSNGDTIGSGNGAAQISNVCIDSNDCLTFTMYDSYGDGMLGTAYGGIDGVFSVTLSDGTVVLSGTGNFGLETSASFSIGGYVCPVLGCTDGDAPNYDATANLDDGSCNFYCNENTTTIEVFSQFGWGMQNGVGMAYTITELATGIDYSNLPAAGYWYSDWDSLCLPTGCYEVAVDGGTNSYPLEIYVNSAPGTVLTGEMFGVGTSYLSVDGAVCPVPGCTDPTADNYDQDATEDDGSCFYSTLADCADPNLTGLAAYVSSTTTTWTFNVPAGELAYITLSGQVETNWDEMNITDGAGNPIASGIDGLLSGLSYTSSDNTIIVAITGDGSVTFEWGWDVSCFVAVPGCTNANADNYDPTATIDDGSCTNGNLADCADPNLTGSQTYVSSTTTTWTFNVPAGELATIALSGQVETNWDEMNITDGAGNPIASGIDGLLSGLSYTSSDNTIIVAITGDGSITYSWGWDVSCFVAVVVEGCTDNGTALNGAYS